MTAPHVVAVSRDEPAPPTGSAGAGAAPVIRQAAVTAVVEVVLPEQPHEPLAPV